VMADEQPLRLPDTGPAAKLGGRLVSDTPSPQNCLHAVGALREDFHSTR
jgi:hypothetical protein